MKFVLMAAAVAVAVALAGCAAGKPEAQDKERTVSARPSDAESEAYMRKAEEDWANLAVKAHPGLMDRILADDYVGVSSENVVVNKDSYLKAAATEKYTGKFISSTLDYVNYRHFGDTVLAQGAEGEAHRRLAGPPFDLDRRVDVAGRQMAGGGVAGQCRAAGEEVATRCEAKGYAAGLKENMPTASMALHRPSDRARMRMLGSLRWR